MPKEIKSQIKKLGFSLIEIAVIAPIVLITIGIFVVASVNMTHDVFVSEVKLKLAYDVNDALNKIKSATLSSGGIAKTSFSYTDNNGSELTINPISPQGSDNGTASWVYSYSFDSNTSSQPLILKTFATDKNPLNTDRGFIYLKNQPNSCASDSIKLNKIMTFNDVYFVKDNKLFRRLVAPSDYNTDGCSGETKSQALPWQLPTCSAGSTTSDYCKEEDKLLLEADNLIFRIKEPLGSGLEKVVSKKAQVFITATRKIGNRDIIYSNSTVISTAN